VKASARFPAKEIGMIGAGNVSKRITGCAMVAVLIATLLWGGCISCSQYFMVSAGGAKRCCMPSGKCKDVPAQPSGVRECKIQPFSLKHAAVNVDHASILASCAALATPHPCTAPGLPEIHAIQTAAMTDFGSPPDLCVIHSVFRI
ncbi:MAG TPA: hypothetical protein VHB50_13180, partial [Bryobacteraceae bacterium]|nr:hypothetical protein [Bryobacteraceae bacterium]